MRKMTIEKRLIDADVFNGLDADAFFNFQHPIHQQNRITVGKFFENLVNIHHGKLSL